MTWFHAARARLRLLPPQAADARIDDEIRFHIEMETQRIAREENVDLDEARRRALVTFGGAQQHRETLREGRPTAWFSGLSLDVKLGFRMLVKYPGLTVIGGLAMAFGIWFGAVTFQMFGAIMSTKLPLPDGDRIVRIQAYDLKASKDEDRVLYDYQLWRAARSITDLGAYRDANVNLVGSDGASQPEIAAEISASAFRIAPERPLLGRVLTEADESAGASPVVVLGEDVWMRRFARDPQIIGRMVKVGNTFATVVGVMPEDFAFPVAHKVWLPLNMSGAGAEPRRGTSIKVFARLAEGMSFENARAEFASIDKRLAADASTTHRQLQTFVTPYAQLDAKNNDMLAMMGLSYFFVVVLMVVVCSTVALLLFARAASRESELLVRSALGASRRRIVAQLFAEALVLAGVSAVVGLVLAQFTLTRLGRPYVAMNYGTLPFWMDFNLSPMTVLYVAILTAVGAVVAGVMPARKITRGLGTHLRAGTAGGGVTFGGVWTAVIVIQVALTVALPAVAMLVRGESKRVEAYDAGFATKEYLGAVIGIDRAVEEAATPEARNELRGRLSASLETLRQRLEAEPGIGGATYSNSLPAEDHGHAKVDIVSLPGTQPRWVTTARVHPSYFDVLQTRAVSGRLFTTADLSEDTRAAIVDQGFVDLVLSGRNPIGHRLRLVAGGSDTAAMQQRWYEIVGVVKELGMASAAMPQRAAGLYLPTAPGIDGPTKLIVHARGDPVALAPRLRAIAAAVDGSLRVEKMTRLDQVTTPMLWLNRLWVRIIGGLTAVALLLSLAGIYAVLAYIVARRTREIGVRVALGASSRLVITSIFRRPLVQVTLGVLAGSVLIFVASIGIGNTTQFRGTGIGGVLSLSQVVLLCGYAAVMLGVCMLACIVPTARALRVQPTEALRAE